VEIPCHAKNIAGTAHAFSSAAAAIGGFDAVIPLDEMAEKMLEVGQTMSTDLRCTSRGGCATTQTALKLARLTGGIGA
jgi:L-serine dehydratase